MMKNWLTLLGCTWMLHTHAQVNVSAQLPPAGMVQKEQLWNLVLMNNYADPMEVTIRMNLQDAANGELVMSATSGTLLLNKGVKLIRAQDIQPLLYNYNRDQFSGSFLPMGAYIACYQLFRIGNKGEELVGDDCVRVNIDPLSPPMLLSPADKSELNTPYPQFTWAPPLPFDMFSGLNYDLLIVEVQDGQSAMDAIQQNTPLYSKSNLLQPNEFFNSSFTALQPDRLYAWQVVAKNDASYSAKTEVWTFRIRKETLAERMIRQTPYVQLKKENAEKTIAPNGILKFSYSNVYTDTTAVLIINDASVASSSDAVLVKASIPVQPGQNLIMTDLKKYFKPAEAHVYRARLVNAVGETWQVMFEVKNYKN